MYLPEQFHSSAQSVVEITTPEHQERRKERLMAILTEGLPTLPSYVFELNTLLSSPSVDLKRVAKVIRSDPSISAQVIRMCNSALFSLRRRVLSIEEAAVLMGSERLRTLVLTCSVMEFTGRQLPQGEVQAFWQHSFMTGMLSERIAKWIEYSEREQAYLGGLLHDVGMLPLLVVAAEEDALNSEESVEFLGRFTRIGKELFWSQSLRGGMLDRQVLEFLSRHSSMFLKIIIIPTRSARDPHLVGIVAAADHFSETHTMASGSEHEAQELLDPASDDEFFALCFPRFDAEERAELDGDAGN